MFAMQTSIFYNATPNGVRIPYDCLVPVNPYMGSLVPDSKLSLHTNYGILAMTKGDYRIAQSVFNYDFMVWISSVLVTLGMLMICGVGCYMQAVGACCCGR